MSITSSFVNSVPHQSVMIGAKPNASLGFSANVARYYNSGFSSFFTMMLHVLTLSHKLKISKPIIHFVSIFVMNDFFLFQIPSKVLFHYKSVLKDVMTSVLCHWMTNTSNKQIPIRAYVVPVFPCQKMFSAITNGVEALHAVFSNFSFNKLTATIAIASHCRMISRSV